MRTTLTKSSLADTSPATAHAGVMVALYPTSTVAHRLAIPGGEKPGELHITLAYLGNAEDVPDMRALRRIVRSLASRQQPLDGTIGGWGRFTASPSSDGKDVIYASADIPALPAFREALVEAIDQTGAEVRKNHGFTPHMTLSYIEPRESAPLHRITARNVTFDAVWLVIGTKRERFPLGRTMQKSEGGQSMGLRQYLRDEPAPTALRKSLRDQGGLRSLIKAQHQTHDETTWGFYDHDDPGEAEGVEDNEQNIVDQEAVTDRPHRPGQHNPRYRKPVAKSDKKKPYNAQYQHPDGTFKGGFNGAVKYFMHVKGYSKAAATKIAGKIAAEKGR